MFFRGICYMHVLLLKWENHTTILKYEDTQINIISRHWCVFNLLGYFFLSKFAWVLNDIIFAIFNYVVILSITRELFIFYINISSFLFSPINEKFRTMPPNTNFHNVTMRNLGEYMTESCFILDFCLILRL